MLCGDLVKDTNCSGSSDGISMHNLDVVAFVSIEVVYISGIDLGLDDGRSTGGLAISSIVP